MFCDKTMILTIVYTNIIFSCHIDIDGPTLCTSRDGDVVMVMRHFKTGRYIHAYETVNEGRLLYEINIDADSRYK